jgi:hypothetical protein
MKLLNRSMRYGALILPTALLAFVVLLVLGCTPTTTNVTVKCATDGMSQSEGVGACMVTSGYTGPIPTAPAGTICKDSVGTTIDCQGNFTCNSGSKCNNPAGTCPANRYKACITYWIQSSGGATTGNCYCDCAP